MLAPVVLFVYNRINHVERSLESLSKNQLARESELFIFSDGPKNAFDRESVEMVRSYLRDFEKKHLFKSITITEAPTNRGLANSIINGVSKILRDYNKVIVVEDDCVSSSDFLVYMNNALEHYQNNRKVWSIGGFSTELRFDSDYEYDTYVMGRTCSYAWATWIDRWEKVDWDVKDYPLFRMNLRKRREFNRFGNDRSKMLDLQQIGKTNSWAIRFCYSMFINEMFTVYPRYSKIKNIGYDVGTHNNGKETRFNVSVSEKPVLRFVDNIEIDERLRKQYIKRFHMNRFKLFASFFLNVVLRRVDKQ